MPTVITHAAVPLLFGAAAGKRLISPHLLAAGAIAAMLPDADVIAFRFDVAYADAFGHRGAAHSLAMALLLGALAALACRTLHTTRWRAFVFVGLAALSHPLLDALTDGGLGVALAWPFSAERFFFPWRPIAVSPIGARFFSTRGLAVLASELRWVWLPCALAALALWLARRPATARVP
jgi:inner membrane protein